MKTTSQPRLYVSGTEQARMLRAALKAEFPGQKFTVRQGGGSSIAVGWADGPLPLDVDRVAQRYRGGGFDGMQDLRYSVETLLTTGDGAELVQFGHDFVFTTRTISEPFADAILRRFESILDDGAPLPRERREWVLLRLPLCVDRDGKLYRMSDGSTEYLSDLFHRYAQHARR